MSIRVVVVGVYVCVCVRVLVQVCVCVRACVCVSCGLRHRHCAQEPKPKNGRPVFLGKNSVFIEFVCSSDLVPFHHFKVLSPSIIGRISSKHSLLHSAVSVFAGSFRHTFRRMKRLTFCCGAFMSSYDVCRNHIPFWVEWAMHSFLCLHGSFHDLLALSRETLTTPSVQSEEREE